MTAPPASQLDLEQSIQLARSRVRHDLKEQTFFQYPFESAITEHHFEQISRLLADQLSKQEYVPAPAPIIDIPKPDWHIRPGALLTHRDLLVYHALAIQLSQRLIPILKWSEQARIRYSHYFDPSMTHWIVSKSPGWSGFDKETLSLLDSGYSHVLFTDISGFYENIDLQRLIGDLRVTGVESRFVTQLSSCLNKWAEPRHRGIPQGCSASDLLAEFYLDPVDRILAQERIVHRRFSDDIRIFGKSVPEVRRGLHKLTRLLRERGLNLQTAKSNIHDTESARAKLSAIQIKMDTLHKSVADELRLLGDIGYEVAFDLATLSNASVEKPAPDVLLNVLDEFASGAIPYNKSLLRYLLNRLADNGLLNARDYVIGHVFKNHPDETAAGIRYLRQFKSELTTGDFEAVVRHIMSDDCAFDYQIFLFLRWFCEDEIASSTLAEHVRVRHLPRWLSHWATAFRAVSARRTGSTQDFDVLMEEYLHADTMERVTILTAMSLAPLEKRKTWWARFKDDHSQIRDAVAWASGVSSSERLFGR